MKGFTIGGDFIFDLHSSKPAYVDEYLFHNFEINKVR